MATSHHPPPAPSEPSSSNSANSNSNSNYNQDTTEAPSRLTSIFGYMQRRLSDLVVPDLGSLRDQAQSAGARTIPTSLSVRERGLEGGSSESRDEWLANANAQERTGLARMTPTLNDSPLHRAGLLQPKSYNASVSSSNASGFGLPHPLNYSALELHAHTQDTIRLATMQLSNMPFPGSVHSTRSVLSPGPAGFVTSPSPMPAHSDPTTPHSTHEQQGGFIFPSPIHTEEGETRSIAATLDDVESPLSESTASLGQTSLAQSTSSIPTLQTEVSVSSSSHSNSSESTEANTPTIPSAPQFQPSGLSLLRPAGSRSSSSSPPNPASPSSATPRPGLISLRGNSNSSTTTTTSSQSPKSTHIEESSTPRPITTIPLPDPVGFGMGSPGSLNTHPPQMKSSIADAATVESTVEVQAESPEAGNERPHRRKSVHWRDPSPLPLSLGAGRHTERTPLLTASSHTYTPPAAYTLEVPPPHYSSPSPPSSPSSSHSTSSDTSSPPRGHKKSLVWRAKHGVLAKVRNVKERVRELDVKNPKHMKTAAKALPAVLLGCLLNILDGVSYGMIIFPSSGIFSDLGPMGVSMFFISTVVAQLVYTFGGSGFAGANGSMMIEVVPFFHILATSIAAQIGEDKPKEIIATTLVAYALSSILTGLSFFLLGFLKLGVIVGFFPRHILVGCIGGVGAFLIITGFAVSMRVDDNDLGANLDTFRMMFMDGHKLTMWMIPMVLAVLLRTITHKWHHQLIFPIYFIAIPILFYVIIAAARLNLGELRSEGWLFDMGSSGQESWYKFYSYLDWRAVQFAPLWSTLPTQFALLFFNILHPPLNVPALAVSLNDDVDTNKELVAHGYSNLLAGLVGTVPNYLVYVNTLLFYRVGGGNRIAGFLLAVATAILLLIGTGPIAFIPVMVVGALIFVLGIDLVKEALWDTRHRVSRTEYITIVSIMVCMTVWDFVIGVLFGIIVSCFFFVVQNSQRRSIRAIYTGDTAMSAVRRPSLQRAYIREVSKQTTILRLQGFLFFGTITYVEETIRSLVEGPSWQHNPVQFLVLDLSLVAGVDMSSAEAFVRIQRVLSGKCVTLVFCGFTADSPVGKALQSVDVLGTPGVELFNNINDAMEWTENAYLRAWFRQQKVETSANALTVPGRQDADIEYSRLVGSFVRSPRRSHLYDVGNRTIANEVHHHLEPEHTAEPLNTLTKAFSSYGDVDPHEFRPIEKYLQRMSVPANVVLWKQGDPSDGLYIIESGVLRATYEFANSARIEESMVPGTVAGELSALSDSPRNATVVVEHAAVLWKLDADNMRRLQFEEPELSRLFMILILKAAKTDYDILLSSLASRQ